MSRSIHCIVGVGNPGDKYSNTRHNAGYWFIDELARQYNISMTKEAKFKALTGRIELPTHRLWLLKPDTFMNLSGHAVCTFMRFYKLQPEQLLVAHDELDLPAGTIRLKQGGGHGGHNGLKSIINCLGSKEFSRLRIGIGHPGHKSQVVGYVLNKPPKEERNAVDQAIQRSLTLSEEIFNGEWQKVMNRLHSQ